MRPLIEAGLVYAAQPPLFSTLVGNAKVYLKDEFARQRFLDEHPNHNKEFQRLKGLGEMDWDELRDTTMDADKRTLLQVTMDDAIIADEVCSILMGDDVDLVAASSRRTRKTSGSSISRALGRDVVRRRATCVDEAERPQL